MPLLTRNDDNYDGDVINPERQGNKTKTNRARRASVQLLAPLFAASLTMRLNENEIEWNERRENKKRIARVQEKSRRSGS
jgi:hypothetical protein